MSYPEQPVSVPERSGSDPVPAEVPARVEDCGHDEDSAAPPSPIERVIAALRQGAAFLVVGLIGLAVDAGTYNLLVFWGGEGVLYHAPIPAKIIAIAVATVVTYFGNKWWTFAHKQTDNPGREYVLYAVFNVVAIGLQLGCLGFSRYVLDLSTPFWDNFFGTFIGQIVAVVFRYWAYGKFVFTGKSERS